MGKEMKFDKKHLRTAIKAIAFLLILLNLFLFFTYLFRNTSRSGRQNILEYYAEPEDTVDVVLIGASNVMRYWDPMQAWNDYGFTSWNFAVSAMNGECYLSAIQEALKTQSPRLVVVETRTFGKSVPAGEVRIGARRLLDAMDMGISRFQAVRRYCDVCDIAWKDAIPLYIDLIYYHNNHEALVTYKNWKWADNRVGKELDRGHQFKGFETEAKHVTYQDPSKNLIKTSRKLDESSRQLLEEIILYCQEEEIELLLLASPIVIRKGEAGKFNTVAEIADAYGVPFINTNLHYEEMGLIFEEDFMDRHHTNDLGATKFTDYFAAYLKENYQLADRRGKAAYKHWDELYGEYRVKKELRENDVRTIIAAKEEGRRRAQIMLQTKDLYEWLELADHEQICILTVCDGAAEHVLNSQGKLALKGFGIETAVLESGTGFINVYQKDERNESTTMHRMNGNIGLDKIKYTIAHEEKPSIVIDGVEYLENCPEDGIYMVAMNHETGEVFDRIAVFAESDGSLSFEHF